MKKKATPKKVEADLTLKVGGQDVAMHISVNSSACEPAAILPFVRSLSDKTVHIAVQDALTEDKSISCTKGCGACCAQLVPVTETEIREIVRIIDNFPKARKQRVLQRFEAAQLKFKEAGLWDALMQPQMQDLHQTTDFGLAYFDQNISCPFLEEGACSIHPARPIACREYLVVSDPKHCEDPRSEKIDGVTIPTRVSTALGVLYEDDENYISSWVPLIVAPYWQDNYPAKPTKKTGPEWVELFLKKLQTTDED